MTPEARVERAASRLKVFPLPSAVLFPGGALPLHIFEPRYRALLGDCIRTDKVMALGDLRPGWERDYAGRPPMEELGCAAVLAWHEELPDGRLDIVLHGVTRYRMLEELPPERAYREVRAQLLPDPPYTGPLEELVRQAVLEIAGRITDEAGENLVRLASQAKGGALADVVGAVLTPELGRKKVLLRELDPEKRLNLALEDVSELIARMGAASSRGPLN